MAVWAATAGSLEVCQWLHEKRADFTKLNKNGHGVLNKAAWRGHDVKLMSFMLALDGVEAQLYEPDWEGELPLDRACQRGAVFQNAEKRGLEKRNELYFRVFPHISVGGSHSLTHSSRGRRSF